jgi:surface antigen
MIALLLLTSSLTDSSAGDVALLEQIMARLNQTPTVQRADLKAGAETITDNAYLQRSQEIAHGIVRSGNIGLSESLCEKLEEPEIAWVLAHELGHLITKSNNLKVVQTEINRAALQIYAEAGYDPLWPSATALHLQALERDGTSIGARTKMCLKVADSNWELAALGLERRYAPALAWKSLWWDSERKAWTIPVPARTDKPTTGTVEHVWAWNDQAWQTWARERGLAEFKPSSQFPPPQCTSLAYGFRPDFKFDPKGSGANNAGNWGKRALATNMPFLPQPRPLAIRVWKPWPGNPYGHVAIVLDVFLDGSQRVIDCNFSGNLDGKVRVRVVGLDSYTEGYIMPPDVTGDIAVLKQGQVRFGSAKAGAQPFYRAAIPRGTMNTHTQYALRLRVRNLESSAVQLHVAFSTTESQTATVPPGTWQWVELKPFLSEGGGVDITGHAAHSLVVLPEYRKGGEAPEMELSDIVIRPLN